MIITKTNGNLEYLVAENITVPHCLTTRYGGVSSGSQESLNLAVGRGDSEGNVDVDGILCKLKDYIQQKGKLELKIPFMPTYKFYAEDIDNLRRTLGG